MKILSLLWNNLRRGVATLRYPAAPPMTSGYRGLVRFDPTLCTGCAVCRFRCTARAITFKAAGKEFTWAYNPAQCTFCGRCVDGCKDHALSQDPNSPPSYVTAGSLSTSYTVKRKTPPPKSPPAPAGTSTQTGDTHESRQ
jgi:formate hydrogenlyase subunit 6/NADH:ubiquinone oxidoreductase subunit I